MYRTRPEPLDEKLREVMEKAIYADGFFDRSGPPADDPTYHAVRQ